jgi:hypothetical protein
MGFLPKTAKGRGSTKYLESSRFIGGEGGIRTHNGFRGRPQLAALAGVHDFDVELA